MNFLAGTFGRIRRNIPLLLFAFFFSIILARLNVELLWFAQFDWQGVLLKRIAFQGIVFLLSIFVVFSLYSWRKRWTYETEISSELNFDDDIKGIKFTLLLLLSFLITIIILSFSLKLALVASLRPASLGYWWVDFATTKDHILNYSVIALLLSLFAIRQKNGFDNLFRFGGFLISIILSRAWGLWALALFIPNTDNSESLLGSDVSFGIGRFPAIEFILILILILLVFTSSTALLSILTRRQYLSDWSCPNIIRIKRKAIRPYLFLVLLDISALIWLSRHQLLWTQKGIVAGAGWLEAQLIIPLRTVLALSTLFLAILYLPIFSRVIRKALRKTTRLISLVCLVFEITFTPLLQWIIVSPRELDLEKNYIQRALTSTRDAFQLNSIKTRLINPNPELTRNDLLEGASTLRNIRLWDSQPLLATNRQLQQLRVYYRFSSAAVDRYKLRPDSEERQQVIITARELDQNSLPKRSRTWLNRHFVFTHGYGFTVSPVNTKASDGLPDYFISDLGNSTNIEGSPILQIDKNDVKNAIPIGRAAIYYGIFPSPYAIAPSLLEEFDYPEGDKNIYNHYSGTGGLPLANLWQKICLAIYLREPRILNTDSITSNSRLLMRREVKQRVKAITPFITFLDDPYLVSVNINEKTEGRYSPEQNQYWILDGYTTSRTYPYAASLQDGEPIRYIRNSVKVIIDAYSGSINYYISEPEDPIIQGWKLLFPELFNPIDNMPSSLREHLKVPTAMFDIQVKQLLRYHVTDPNIFYSGDDVWQVPVELYGKKQVPVEPYHITAQLRPNIRSEFLLLQPLAPLARPNLSAWLAARSDGDKYGELVLLRFPSETSIFGPEQIQALINQNPEISEQFSLWDRAGSEVIQGNLLVLPLGKALLYVEPVYLKATQGGLPTLTRVVVSDGKRVSMEEDLNSAINSLLEINKNDSK